MMVLLLHLTVGSVDIACANHEESAASQPVDSNANQHSNHPDEPEHHGTHQHHHGELPGGQPCCSAMASCSLTIATSPAETNRELHSRHERPNSHMFGALSWSTTPDPPPPRA